MYSYSIPGALGRSVTISGSILDVASNPATDGEVDSLSIVIHVPAGASNMYAWGVAAGEVVTFVADLGANQTVVNVTVYAAAGYPSFQFESSGTNVHASWDSGLQTVPAGGSLTISSGALSDS
jgi:hypothetical protein